MKVILLEKVNKLGDKLDIKEVSAGYARNFLLPKKLAMEVTEANLKKVEKQKQNIEIEKEKRLTIEKDLVSKINNQEIIFAVKVGDKNQLFESINEKKISEKLKEAGFNIEKENISLTFPIKELGEYNVKLDLGHELKASIKIKIVKE